MIYLHNLAMATRNGGPSVLYNITISLKACIIEMSVVLILTVVNKVVSLYMLHKSIMS